MTVYRPDTERRLVPRWRASGDAIIAGEVRSITRAKKAETPGINSPRFAFLEDEWKRTKDIDSAAEIVACGVSLGLFESSTVKSASEFLVKSRTDLEVVSIARNILNGSSGTAKPSTEIPFDSDQAKARIIEEIQWLKRRVRDYTKNSVAWTDLARLYAAIGQIRQAEKAIEIATSISPDSRFIVRSAARFYVHAHHESKDDAIEKGLRLLRKSALIRVDPWVMSAEISLAMIGGTAPKSYKSAKSISESDALNPWDSSELNGALATLALVDGGMGKPGKLFSKSLRSPTENALAQAQWASSNHRGISVPDAAFLNSVSPTHEAQAIRYQSEERWTDCIEACKRWSMMEPTSTRPLMLGGFVAEVALEDGQSAKEFFLRAQVLAPNDPWANNNLAVALAYCGELEEAASFLAKNESQHLDDRGRAVHLATKGLLAYRSGDPIEGRALYLQASKLGKEAEDQWVTAMSIWHLLREESRYETDGVDSLADELWKKTSHLKIPELKAFHAGIVGKRASVIQRVKKGLSDMVGMQQHQLISPEEIVKPFSE